ncbi:MAG: hypothetical protein L0Y55_06605 [Anaerolineales bacterium]|nr:hypothetical protein [Anaerolineales bacterium]
MSVNTLTLELGNVFALPESEIVRKGLFALIEKEIRLTEQVIAELRERYDVFSKEALYQAIQNGKIAGHPAWEDYIVWKNKEEHIARLQQAAAKV